MCLIFIPRPAPRWARNRGYRRWFHQEPSGVSRGYWIPPGSVSNFFDTLRSPLASARGDRSMIKARYCGKRLFTGPQTTLSLPRRIMTFSRTGHRQPPSDHEHKPLEHPMRGRKKGLPPSLKPKRQTACEGKRRETFDPKNKPEQR